MSEKPPQHDPTLDYWQPADPPLHPLARALCVLGGLILGSILMGFVGTALMAGVLSASGSGHPGSTTAPLVVGFSLSAGMFVWFGVYLYRGRNLSIERRTRGSRYFLAGMLLGCCLMILLQGLCFSVLPSI